ncbi:hypothetical protein, partial [Nonomuraea sp. NPDC049784]|uniref:hypothetical protein n=1 Tax=Nonomuraea sp. NPDC049784 TaxID=3154361 RepID=UPI0033C50354
MVKNTAYENASARAVATGQKIEIVSERTEFSTTYANPDGATYSEDISAVPLRVRAADGGWTAPDATLVRHADGTFGPKAAMVNLSFSGGGAGPMVA